MSKFALVAIGVLVSAQVAGAATWSIISFSTTPQNAPAIVAAADALMGSEVGKEFPGRLFLQVNLADGSNPATHSFVPVYNTAADREAFVQKLEGNAAWTGFQQKMQDLSQPVSNTMYRTMQRWGDIDDTDLVWRAHSFDVDDGAAFVKALDTFMKSETGKKFPGQVFLSSVLAGGITPVSHVITVGQASEAAIEAWEQQLQGSDDWEDYLDASGDAAEYLGNNMIRTVKTWGKSLDEATQ